MIFKERFDHTNIAPGIKITIYRRIDQPSVVELNPLFAANRRTIPQFRTAGNTKVNTWFKFVVDDVHTFDLCCSSGLGNSHVSTIITTPPSGHSCPGGVLWPGHPAHSGQLWPARCWNLSCLQNCLRNESEDMLGNFPSTIELIGSS